MSGKRRKRSRNARASLARPARADSGALLALASLLAILACSGLLVDSSAEDPFDAPKRLAALMGIAVATAAAFAFTRWENPFSRRWSAASRAIGLLAGAALVLALLSALASPRRAASADAARALLLTGLLLPLGASRVLDRHHAFVIGMFLAIAAVDALVSILQARGVYRPFPLQTRAAREVTGAFVGNVGYLALLLALAAVTAASVALLAARAAPRIAAAALLLLFAAALLVNQNLTSLSALAAGVLVLLLLRFGRRAVVPGLAAVALLAAAVAAYGPTRQRASEVIAAARSGDWDRVLTYRLGPWAAAREMTRERPLLGWGPGTFEAEFVPHRLAAEIAAHRRYVNPLTTSSYAEAHSDYVQPFAELGVPAALLAIGAAALLGVEIVRTARRGEGERRREAIFLAAFLAAGAAAALTWFPLQRPVTSVPLLLAMGRAWRLSRGARAAAP